MKRKYYYVQQNQGRNFLTLTLTAVASTLAIAPAHGQQTWDNGNADQDWNNPVNWTSDTFPNGQNATVDTSAAGQFPIISTTPTSGTPVDIFVGSATGQTGRLDQTAGTAGTGSGNWLFIGQNGGTGTMNVADTSATGGANTNFGQGSGSFFAGGIHVGGREFGSAGVGTLNINTSGNVNSTGRFHVGYQAGAVGTVNLDNGNVGVTGELALGFTSSTSEGYFNQSGGNVSVDNWLSIGRSGIGVYELSGGSLTKNSGTDVGQASLGGLGTGNGTLNISGGTFTSNEDFNVGENGTGTLNISGTGAGEIAANKWMFVGKNTGSSGTVNLEGGSLTVRHIELGSGTGSLNFNGGKIIVNSSADDLIESALTTRVKAGGATIDTAGFDKTLGADLLEDSVSTGGGFTKTGLGVLTSNNIVLTGGITVSEGTLRSTGSLSTTDLVTVESGASIEIASGTFDFSTLGGAGTIDGAVHFDAGDALDMGLGTLTLTSGSSLSFDSFSILDVLNFSYDNRAVASYTLIDGDFSLNSANIANFGEGNALDLGDGWKGYFSEGSLQWSVVPEPSTTALGGLSILGLLLRRRRK